MQNLISMQPEPSAVITPIQPIVISTPSSQLTLPLVLDGVCPSGDGSRDAPGVSWPEAIFVGGALLVELGQVGGCRHWKRRTRQPDIHRCSWKACWVPAAATDTSSPLETKAVQTFSNCESCPNHLELKQNPTECWYAIKNRPDAEFTHGF